jgi:hypothetical protein
VTELQPTGGCNHSLQRERHLRVCLNIKLTAHQNCFHTLRWLLNARANAHGALTQITKASASWLILQLECGMGHCVKRKHAHS